MNRTLLILGGILAAAVLLAQVAPPLPPAPAGPGDDGSWPSGSGEWTIVTVPTGRDLGFSQELAGILLNTRTGATYLFGIDEECDPLQGFCLGWARMPVANTLADLQQQRFGGLPSPTGQIVHPYQ